MSNTRGRTWTTCRDTGEKQGRCRGRSEPVSDDGVTDIDRPHPNMVSNGPDIYLSTVHNIYNSMGALSGLQHSSLELFWHIPVSQQ